ncbi:heavy-metal-associated domain-containing protein [Verrucomicrobiaceae bacterium 5K15]|uniref:Heavy-metal-associated domain-containing protein n=1 Tax=Oceaniferula flava TaxID=2800421 RepID=A0AAE2SFV4_9BACT|nr:heavy-metal-associated domain-containing protein [Oceaniferula flavus]MBK1855820.1 heavy-metal-associated domain-containing protein [Oceaniferula flavus]MBM1137127.1 heavy-metal-associated domain-containing protein [Oceaniferula flavus]
MIKYFAGTMVLGCAQVVMAGGATCDTTAAACADKTECAAGACDVASVAEGQELHTYVVTGMTCGGCSGAVTKSVASVEGVTVKKVCHESGTATVVFDPSKVKASDVQAAIAKGKFAVTAERFTVPVSGMTCSSCSGKVTKALGSLEGVTVKTVCHESGKAVVDVDTSKSNRAAVVKAITATGFKAS